MTSEVPNRWVPGHLEPPKRDKTWIAFSCGAEWEKKDQAHLASKALKNCAASSEPVDAIQVLHSLHETVCHALLPSPERHARVVILLIRLLRALGVADLALEVVHVLLLVLIHAIPEGPLRVRVDVHLNDAGLDGVLDVLHRGAGAAVEDEGHGLVALATQLLLDVLLRVVQDHRLELYVARRVHAMHVAEGGGHGELAVGHR